MLSEGEELLQPDGLSVDDLPDVVRVVNRVAFLAVLPRFLLQIEGIAVEVGNDNSYVRFHFGRNGCDR